MYVIVRDDDRKKLAICGTTLAENVSDACALLRAYQLEYPTLASSCNARIMRLTEFTLRDQLEGSLCTMEVPSAEANG